MIREAAGTLLIVAFLVGTPGMSFAQGQSGGGDAPGQAPTDVRFIDTRDQGIHYYKKKKYQHAYRILKRAYGMPNGNADFLATFYLARAAAKLLLLERAFDLAEQAESLAKDDERYLDRVEEFTSELKAQFGKLTLVAAEGETNSQGRIFFESKTGILNKEKRERFMSIRERFRSTDVSLPTTVFLPYGEYLANNVPCSIQPEKEAPKVAIYLQVQVASGSDTWLWVGLGAAAVVAVGTGIGVYLLSQDDNQQEALRIYSLETQ